MPAFFIGGDIRMLYGRAAGHSGQLRCGAGYRSGVLRGGELPIASLILSVELFGAGELSYFAIACGVSYMLSGYYGIYQSQEIRYSKLKPEKIEIHAK